MSHKDRIIFAAISATALVLAGCSSDGSYRASGVSSAGTAGSGSEAVEDDSGTNGNGMGNDDIALLGDNDSLATGGLVGSNGLAGTGLLANTGNPDNQAPIIANLLTASGETVNLIAGTGMKLTSAIDPNLASDNSITGTVIGVVEDTGDALIRTGEGEEYLVDGLVAAPGELITTNIGDTVLLGSEEATPLIGASVLSADQIDGNLATVGLASNGDLITLDVNLNDTTLGLDNGLTDGLSSGGNLGDTTSGLTDLGSGGDLGTGGGDGGIVSGTASGAADVSAEGSLIDNSTSGAVEGALDATKGIGL